MSSWDRLVVGGGPAGMMAAIAAAEAGERVLLLERNEKLGKKLYITGKGRCNLTNACDREAFFSAVPRNPRFLFSAYSRFDNQALMALMERSAVPLTVERGNRVFPVSQKSSDVIRALSRMLEALGVEIKLNTRVQSLRVEEGAVTGVVDEEDRFYPACRVVLATGGLAYPSTGSTGDGYRMAKEWGHKLVQQLPSLVSLEVGQSWAGELQGLSLKNVRLSARVKGRVFFDQLGEMMFTHYGVTGPLVLTLSALLPESDLQAVQLALDTKPGLTPAQLERRIRRDFATYSQRRLAGALVDLLPQRLLKVVIAAAGLTEDQSIHHLSKAQWTALLEAIKALPMTVRGRRGFDEAVITRGGVNVGQVDPKTMASKVVKGLYFAGEVLDVDAFTGGYNLQIAFTTGYCAGKG